jgi:hypothetical protein
MREKRSRLSRRRSSTAVAMLYGKSATTLSGARPRRDEKS